MRWVFSADRNSVVTARELRHVAVAFGIPLVLTGKPRRTYSVFTSAILAGWAEPIWTLPPMATTEGIRAVVERALAERSPPEDAARAEQRSRAPVAGLSWVLAATAFMAAMSVAGDVLRVTRPAPDPAASASSWANVVFLMLWCGVAAWNAIAATRRGLRLPRGAVVSLSLILVMLGLGIWVNVAR